MVLLAICTSWEFVFLFTLTIAFVGGIIISTILFLHLLDHFRLQSSRWDLKAERERVKQEKIK